MVSSVKSQYKLLENQLKRREKQDIPAYISVYCKKCKDYHSVPNKPGKYEVCRGFNYFLGVVVKEDGKVIITHNHYKFLREYVWE